MTFSEEFEHIKAAIYDNPRQDPGRLETCLSIALEALGRIGDQSVPRAALNLQADAIEALRRIERRVKVGEDLRPGEHQTLDWDYPEPRYMETLSPGPEGGDWG